MRIRKIKKFKSVRMEGNKNRKPNTWKKRRISKMEKFKSVRMEEEKNRKCWQKMKK